MADNSVTATTPAHLGTHRGSTSCLTYSFTGSVQELHSEFTDLMSEATAIINHLAIEIDSEGSELQANPREAAQLLWSALRTMELATSVGRVLNERTAPQQREA